MELYTTTTIWTSTNNSYFAVEFKFEDSWLRIKLVRKTAEREFNVYLENERRSIYRDIREIAKEIVEHFSLNVTDEEQVGLNLRKLISNHLYNG